MSVLDSQSLVTMAQLKGVAKDCIPTNPARHFLHDLHFRCLTNKKLNKDEEAQSQIRRCKELYTDNETYLNRIKKIEDSLFILPIENLNTNKLVGFAEHISRCCDGMSGIAPRLRGMYESIGNNRCALLWALVSIKCGYSQERFAVDRLTPLF